MSSLDDTNVLITGGAGFLGLEHGVAVASAGGRPILVDIDREHLDENGKKLMLRVPGCDPVLKQADVVNRRQLEELRLELDAELGPVHCVVNNAAINPTMEKLGGAATGSLEDYPLEAWNQEFSVGVTGALLMCQVFGAAMAERGKGSIINIASDLAVIAPDHRIYEASRKMENVRNFKPVSYVVGKAALVGLTRYVSTYWAHRGVRCNALAPGGVFTGQDAVLVEGLKERIPMGRMANPDEYHGALIFLCSEASSYMTGQVMVIDGGRSVW